MPPLAQLHVNTIAAASWLPPELRLHIYRQYGIHAAAGTYISSRCLFVHPDLSNIWLGERSFLNHECFIENGDAIRIGSNSCLGPRVSILTTTHQVGSSDRRVGHGCVRKPVVIGDGCWICAGATILPGVTIGDGCIIAAGALVKDDCLPNGLYAGVPARRVKDL